MEAPSNCILGRKMSNAYAEHRNQRERRGRSSASSQSGNLSFPQTPRLETKTKWKKRRFLSRRTINSKSQAARQNMCAVAGCVNRWHAHEKFCDTATRLMTVKNGSTFAAPTRYQPLTKEQRERVAHEWHLAQTSRGAHNTTESTNHPEYSLASPLKPKSTESPRSPDAHSGDKSRARTPSQSLSGLQPAHIHITNLVMDRLGSVT